MLLAFSDKPKLKNQWSYTALHIAILITKQIHGEEK